MYLLECKIPIATVWPTISELSPEEYVCLQLCCVEYSGN